MVYIFSKEGFKEYPITKEEAEGIVELQNRDSEIKQYVYEGDSFPPDGKKIDPKTGELVDKTEQEKLDDGDISLAEIKERLYQETNKVRDEILSIGNLDTIKFELNNYDADTQAVNNVQMVLTHLSTGGKLPDGFIWRSADNIDVPMDQETFQRFAQTFTTEFFIWKNNLYLKSWSVKEQIKNLKKSNILSFNVREAMK